MRRYDARYHITEKVQAQLKALPSRLGDAAGPLRDGHGEPIEIVWKNSAQSAARLGAAFDDIVAVLRRAEERGRIKLRLG